MEHFMKLDFSCRHFTGDKPCPFSEGKKCPVVFEQPEECISHSPLGKKILIIKLGALGDVLRTTTLLAGFSNDYSNHSVVWLTSIEATPLLQGAPIWKILPWNLDSILFVESISWDIVICLDKEEAPTALASRLQANLKAGFGRNEHGMLVPLSKASNYLFKLGIDDPIKFHQNSTSYPKLIADDCEISWGPNKYQLSLTETEKAWAKDQFSGRSAGPLVGFNIGSGGVFAGRRWPANHFIDLATELGNWGIVPVFLGGIREIDLYAHLLDRVKVPAIFPGVDFSLREFCALVSQLKVMVSGDSLAMHIAIALDVYTVALFGSTTAKEIELYGRGQALVGEVNCAPCFRKNCPTDEECMQQIGVGKVFQEIQKGLKQCV